MMRPDGDNDDDDDDGPRAMIPQTSPLTSSQFRHALSRHVDTSKPDPLARKQIEKLFMNWMPDDVLRRRPRVDRRGDGRSPTRREHRSTTTTSPTTITASTNASNATPPTEDDTDIDDCDWKVVCGGTLTLSSEHITIAIVVGCEFRTTTTTTTEKSEEESDEKPFEDEFYFRLAAYAYFPSSSSVEYGDDDGAPCPSSGDTDGRRERPATSCKLRSGMKDRLLSDPSVRRLLVNDRGIDGITGDGDGRRDEDITTLCEALIQRGKRDNELEERVDVNEMALDGIRNAILGHTEDNLDVLDILLNMPYLPRSLFVEGGVGGDDRATDSSEVRNGKTTTKTNTTLASSTLRELAQRAYLRLLEDAMFDACEREGEDELLDDLDIS